jgi:ABC-type polysaccharide/polyol phosphate transport system ATPase subunit
MSIIEFKDVWEMYRVKFVVDGRPSWEDFWALQGISFSMRKGELLGIIGENGSGKSTILRLIAGMLKPDRGQVNVSGSVAGLLELGAGFQTELTGRENIFLQSELFGLSAAQTRERLRGIVDFAEIGRFIDAPVKCYSQGMFVRLAFAIAVHMDSDIFVVDDTLAVGDEYFKKKCVEEMFKIKHMGKTVIVVTHDMSVLQKLCARTIVLKQGRLIKDESTSRAISLYSQTVGSPKGIAVIEREPLSLVFNNGKLLLNWANRLITLPCGVYTSCLISGLWYGSSQAEWDVEESQGKIVATGKFYHLAMAQIWKLEVSENHEIRWDVEIEMENDAPLPELYVNAVLLDDYKKWFADLEEGEFPQIKEEDKYWKHLSLKNNSSLCIGVPGQDSPQGSLPSLLFEQSRLRYHSQALILNSDYANSGRILQYKTAPSSVNPVNQPGRFLCFSGKIILGLPDAGKYIRGTQRDFTVSKDKLKLVFDNGRLSLFFDNLALTKSGNMYYAFYSGQRWFSSDAAFWTLEKKAENLMVARGVWNDAGVTQIWRLDVSSGHSFSWEVDLEVERQISIEQQRLRCFLSEGFKTFFGDFVSEDFSDLFKDTDVDLLKRCISSGQVGLHDPSGKLPEITVSFSEELGNFAKVFNSDYYNKSRILHLEKVEPEIGVLLAPGRHKCFKTEFRLEENRGTAEPVSSGAIEDGKIRFVFKQGSGRFYNGAREITKNMGMYTSLRCGGHWYDSASSAHWKISMSDGKKVAAAGKWLDLPLCQEWEITALGKGVFAWKAGLEIFEDLELDRLQVNIMFSELFSRYLGGGNERPFPEFRDDVDDDWDCLWRAEGGSREIGLVKDSVRALPAVSFAPGSFISGWELKVINSDRYHRGRVLQYSSSLKTRFLPGKTGFFSGLLTIRE